MAKFIYRMENILNIKIKLEDQARMEFGLAQLRLNEEEEKLETLKSRKAWYEDMARGLLSERLSILDIKEAREAIERMDEYIAAQRIEVNKARQNLEVERQKLQKAVQERKIQEKLKENAFEEFKLEEKAAESQEINELVSYTYGKKTGEEDGRS